MSWDEDALSRRWPEAACLSAPDSLCDRGHPMHLAPQLWAAALDTAPTEHQLPSSTSG